MKHKACITLIIKMLKLLAKTNKIQGKYLAFCRVIRQDVKQLIKYFKPGEIAGERRAETRTISMQVKNFNRELRQDWYVSDFPLHPEEASCRRLLDTQTSRMLIISGI